MPHGQALTHEQQIHRHARATSYGSAMAELSSMFAEGAKAIAKDHGRSVGAVMGMAHQGTRRVMKERTTTPWMVFITDVLRKKNENLRVGEKLTIPKLLAKDGRGLTAAYNALTKEAKDVLVAEAIARRRKRVVGMRSNPKAIQRDFVSTFNAIERDIGAATLRDQCEAICIAVKSNPFHHQAPALIMLERVKGWLRLVYNTTPSQMAMLFEAYICSSVDNGSGSRGKKSINEDVKFCRLIIQDSFNDILHKHGKVLPSQSVPMNYSNYEGRITEVYHVELQGWPVSGGVINPGDLKRDQLTKLVKALEDETCLWVALNAIQIKERIEKNKAWQASGEQVYKPQKAPTKCSKKAAPTAASST
ncbi:hypothetical protein OF83DRAFT_1190121 [Amylostereum chailletii]|nr:hypothetical protein OF83DRAFT_1190121 [Amylostereum chailletii]